jgi:acyl-CoA reductase-like NAD-dependent aldehyde dehydrogenase
MSARAPGRLPVTKTPKVYIGGAFVRSESARTFKVSGADGVFFGNIPQCTRKDLRNAVEAAAKAGPGWARRTPYNRAQILYRLAEMLEARSPELVASLVRFGAREADASRGMSAAVDRMIHYAGWADKYEHLLGSVNPVASPHFNFTVTEPMGVVGVIAPDSPPLLGLLSMVAPVIASGNTVVALASEKVPYPAILLGEMLATSDLPGGVVNILTGLRRELVPTFATHAHIRAVYAAVDGDDRKALRLGAAASVKRVRFVDRARDWPGESAQGLDEIRDFVELKTIWHPIGS